MVEILVARGECFTQTLLRGPDGRFFLRSEGRWWKKETVTPFKYLCDVSAWVASMKYCADPAEREAALEVVMTALYAN